MNISKNTRGDTIIEVLLASVILSIVLAGAYSLSSRATRINQASYERTRASNLIQEQAELLREVSDNNPDGIWDDIIDLNDEPLAQYYDCRPDGVPLHPDTPTDNVFYLAPKLDVPQTDADFGKIELTLKDYKQTDGLYNTWVSLNNDGSAGYYDFYIHTCWEGIGSIGNQVTGAVVRLEAP